VVGMLLHSCSPNAMVNMTSLEVVALHGIKAGDAITMDYETTEDVLYRAFNCECGSPNCRGRITGRRGAAWG
jgi:hypothetical protein